MSVGDRLKRLFTKQAPPPELERFRVAAGDPLSIEHALVSKWIEDALASRSEHDWYRDVDFKTVPSGQQILDAKPDQGRRLVIAALDQVQHWDRQAEAIRAQAKSETERMNAHWSPGWNRVWGRRRQAAAVIFSLIRRALPFESDDLIALMQWCSAVNNVSTYFAPVGGIVKAVERYASTGNEIPPELREAMQQFAAALRRSHDKNIAKLGTTIEQLNPDAIPPEKPNELSAAEKKSHPLPAPAGDPRVLAQLKRHLGIVVPGDETVPTETIDPDRFLLRTDSPLQAEHRFLSDLFGEVIGTSGYSNPPITELKAGALIQEIYDAGRGRLLLASTERSVAGQLASVDYSDHGLWQSRYAAAAIVSKLAALNFVLDRNWTFDYLLYVAARVTPHARFAHEKSIEQCLALVEHEIEKAPLAEGERYVLHLLRTSFISGSLFNRPGPDVLRLNRLIGDGAAFFLVPGEAWSDALNDDLTKLPGKRQQPWMDLLKHLLTATSPRPSGKWLKTAEQLIKGVGKREVTKSLERWLPLVSKGGSVRRAGAYVGDTRGEADTMPEENATCLRGMMWITSILNEPETLARLVTNVALSAYKKVPGVGPRAVKVGNAAVYALSEMGSPDAVGQLALLKVRVKFGTAQKEIEKAFNSAADALGLPRDQIEEMGVPSYGLEEVGLRREMFGNGEFSAELRVDGRDVELHWSRSDGKPQKSVPAKVKSEHKEEFKELQAAVKDIAAMLPAQAERLDAMFLAQRQWDFAVWRERYLDHPLIGTLARRLIWTFNDRAGIWHDGKLRAADDQPLDLSENVQVGLWHPIGRPTEDVLAWRRWLESHEVRQPFKQAHREVYVLTDAERRTNTYSNRFAAHVLRQHQFNALCAARGWKNKLRLMVDDTYPPASRQLPNFGLRAEFWIEGIGDGYGTDTNESGAFLRVASDQVRFYRISAATSYVHAAGGGYRTAAAGPGDENVNEPLPLHEIPPLVFSEIMRDVDLFVGVASVGNDPAWQDGGPDGRYLTYWQGYSFGELTETAKTRRDVLDRLLPRLKIAARCSLTDKFLVVRGDVRTYKIHLGSGNILMEPNDQYLCIVPDRRKPADGEQVFLPFEGDATLSVIISKAFLLADDRSIKDSTILTQIQRR